MLKPGFNAVVGYLSSAVPTSRHARCSFSRIKRRSAEAGRMGDVLDLLGPLDAIFPPSAGRLYANLFRKALKSRNAMIGYMAQAHLMKSGLVAETLVSNILLNVFAKAGQLCECGKLFDEMPLKDIISWCTLISGFVNRGLDLEAFRLLKRVWGSGLKPNQFIVSAILKGCSSSEDPALGTQIHAVAVKLGVMFDSFVEVGLISMYAKHGAIAEAIKLFYEIPVKCLASWNAMISGYVQHGLFSDAMDLSREMCRMGFVMDLVALRVVMAAGSALGTANFCQNLDAYSIKIGLDSDNFVVAEHVRLLSRLGEVDAIGKFFARVRKPDACLYTLTITGYSVNGHRPEAVKHADQLLKSGLSMNPGSIVTLLNLCRSKEESSQLHAHILKNGHDSHLSATNALISAYAYCEEMEDAQRMFDEMPEHDVISWTAIMSGHAQNSQSGEAFRIFQAFRWKGLPPDEHTLTTIVNACSAARATGLGQQCHALALKHGVDFSEYLSSSLLHMYSKCGDVDGAAALFYGLSRPRGSVAVNVMLAGYTWNSSPEKAVELFCTERGHGFVPNEFTFSAVLGACADMRLTAMGEQMHSCVIKMGLESFDVVVGNAMIKLYMKSGKMESARRSFYGMKHRDSSSYAVMISGFAQNRCGESAMKLFSLMHRSGLSENPVAFASVLRSCASSSALAEGKQVHALVLKAGCSSDPLVSSSLMGIYAKYSGVEVSVKSGDMALTGDCSPSVDFFERASKEMLDVWHSVDHQGLTAGVKILPLACALDESTSGLLSTPRNLRCIDFQRESRRGLKASFFSNGRKEKRDGLLVFLGCPQMDDMATRVPLEEHGSQSTCVLHAWDSG